MVARLRSCALRRSWYGASGLEVGPSLTSDGCNLHTLKNNILLYSRISYAVLTVRLGT